MSSMTFLLCQVIFSSIALSKSNSNSSSSLSACPGCQRAAEAIANGPVDFISAEDVRREMLKWEKQRILDQLDMPDDQSSSTTVTSTTTTTTRRPIRSLNSSRRRLRKPRAAAMKQSFSNDDGSNANETEADVGEQPEFEEYMETAIIMGQQVVRGNTTSYQCYDEDTGLMGTCIDFKNSTEIKWDRFKMAVVRFLLEREFWNGHQRMNHTFSIKAINFGRTELSGGFYPTNVTRTLTRPNQYIDVDVYHQLLRRSQAHAEWATVAERKEIQENITLRVTCLTCRNRSRSPISLDPTRLPFLEIGFTNRKKRSSPQCEMTNEYMVKDTSRRGCCMVAVDVDFNEIGMEYIIYPPRYRTHYCSGRCPTITTRSYSAIVQKLINLKLQKLGVHEQISLCCVPVATHTLEIIYQNATGHVAKSNLRDMLVTSCGC